MKHVTAKELKTSLDSSERIKLVNALEENKFRLKHIPGSINIFRKEDIQNNLIQSEKIIVYCTDSACNRSIILYQWLEALGYDNMYRFAGGLVEWEKEGYPLEGEMVK